MDEDLDTIIGILNPKKKLVIGNKVRTRNPKADQRPKPTRVCVERPSNTEDHLELEPELISEINEFYKEGDEEYKKSLNEKIGAPILWLRHRKRENSTSKLKRKYLEFRPYIDPMNIRPTVGEDRGYYYKMHNSDVKLIRFLLEDNGFLEVPPGKSNWTLMWHGGVVKSHVFQSLAKYQKVNHFPRSQELTRKDLMYKNIARMQDMHGLKNFGFVPRSFILPQDAGELEYEMATSGGTWIVKPSASSQGKGIYLVTRFGDVPKKDYVVSRYIDNPLLIDGLKFDLRIYVAVTSIHPLRIYVHKEGLVRFATQKYSAGNKGSRFMHLTNYSVNKYSQHFVENNQVANDGTGSKWSLSALRSLFQKHGFDFDPVFEKIKDLIIKSILSVESHLFSGFEMHVPYKGNCFELLGFDVLIDDTLTPWLLEVNLSPSLNCDSPIDQKIKGELISELFTLIGVVSMDARNSNKTSNSKASCYHAYNNQPVSSKKRKNKTGWNFNTKPNSSDCLKEAENKEERAALRETNEEYKRKGNFERIFPSDVSINYKNFFERERPLNLVVCSKLGKIHRKGQGTSAVVYRKPPRIS